MEELTLAIILGVITVTVAIVTAMIKKGVFGNKSVRDIEDKVKAINNISHLQKDVDEIKIDIGGLRKEIKKTHSENDKIFEKISEINVKIAELRIKLK